MPDHSPPVQPALERTVFFVSDGTGITAETLGHSVLTQFEGLRYRQQRLPFIDTPEKARIAAQRINEAGLRDGKRAVVFSTLVDPAVAGALRQHSNAFVVEMFKAFVEPLEIELDLKSAHTIGRSHQIQDSEQYKNRIEAINFTLAHDDGQSSKGLKEADVILVGVSRCGKTPTSLYLAMQFGLKAANYPLIPEDFERNVLPSALPQHKNKIFGLSISPDRLSEVRNERRPNSRYASIENCRYEIDAAERMMRREGIRWLSSTTKSIEEIAATIMQDIRLGCNGD
ncbi:MAG: pyruvate, water dikinase regulatory protein [Burkholderiaceae bacterium]